MINSLAPIILFVYKRKDTLIKTVEALKKNYLAKESDLIIYSDAPKNCEDKLKVIDVRKYLYSIEGFKSITIRERKENKGLANSIIQGVSEVIIEKGSVIVLEDDLISSPNFLTFMNESLNLYKNEKNVFSISGFSFDMGLSNKLDYDGYFLNRGWSWGWATWVDRWELIEWETENNDFFIRNKSQRKEFSNGGSDLNVMLDNQIAGKLDSWAIRWFYNQFKLKGLTLYPIESKILNIGFGMDATHTTGSPKRYIPVLDRGLNCDFKYPSHIKISEIAQRKFQIKMSYFSRVRSKIETYLLICYEYLKI